MYTARRVCGSVNSGTLPSSCIGVKHHETNRGNAQPDNATAKGAPRIRPRRMPCPLSVRSREDHDILLAGIQLVSTPGSCRSSASDTFDAAWPDSAERLAEHLAPPWSSSHNPRKVHCSQVLKIPGQLGTLTSPPARLSARRHVAQSVHRQLDDIWQAVQPLRLTFVAKSRRQFHENYQDGRWRPRRVATCRRSFLVRCPAPRRTAFVSQI
jgi:hypothetical protein